MMNGWKLEEPGKSSLMKMQDKFKGGWPQTVVRNIEEEEEEMENLYIFFQHYLKYLFLKQILFFT